MAIRKFDVDDSVLYAAGLDYRLYSKRRRNGETHESAMQTFAQRCAACRVRKPVLFSITAHIQIRKLYADGMSVEALRTVYPYISSAHVDGIIAGVNYCDESY